MLAANQAVGAKVQELNASAGTVLTVNPCRRAGLRRWRRAADRNQAANGATGITGSTTQPRPVATRHGIWHGRRSGHHRQSAGHQGGLGAGRLHRGVHQRLLGATLAEKNSLTVGSTFTINDQTHTVTGLFDAGTTFGNNAVYVTLHAAQALAGLPGELASIIVTVDSLENVASTHQCTQPHHRPAVRP